jgi:hypothetical protein
VFEGIRNAGLLDFVAAWYVKTARLIADSRSRCAFVSTNSICQGELLSIFWPNILELNLEIFFHKITTLKWILVCES